MCKKTKDKGPVTIPPRCVLPDGSSVDFGHEGNLNNNNNNNGDTNKENSANNIRRNPRQRGSGAKHNRVMLKSTSDDMKSTTQDLKKLLISDVIKRSKSDSGKPKSDQPRARLQCNSHLLSRSGSSSSSSSSSSSRTRSRSRSRSHSHSDSHSNSRSPPISASSSSLNSPSAVSVEGYAELRIPGIQTLPDGSLPNFGASPLSAGSSNSYNSSSYPYKHTASGTRKSSNSTSITSYSNNSSSLVYAGSSFHSSPSAVSLPRPSFSKK
ncbi:hypothetical protein FOA43_001686 [Brettanomyces nanus]|uniref:Uncharacterized protein n=1 Tax=Eeniella nana TaxID=13502 RepID=A0A875S3I4_EENNA|nr:uncharacterized protein FOA43_001686 [Brettanomyces nanus]QPG74359.1 hypothetical protein FOA43_001686 [Brettanomyces nanus]